MVLALRKWTGMNSRAGESAFFRNVLDNHPSCYMVDIVRYESLIMCAQERLVVWGTTLSDKHDRAFSYPRQATNRSAL